MDNNKTKPQVSNKRNQGGSASLEDMLALAQQYQRSGNLRQAESLYQTILNHNPQYSEAWHQAGILAMQAGQLSVAINRLQQAIQLNPKQPAYYINLGNTYQQLNNAEKAIEYYQLALNLKPNYAEGFNNLGAIYSDIGELEKAIKAIKQALAINPHYTDAYGNLGNIYLERGDLAQAFNMFKKANYYRHNNNDNKTYMHTMTSKAKLQHDYEQLVYLQENNLISKDKQSLDNYQLVLSELNNNPRGDHIYVLTDKQRELLGDDYNKNIYCENIPAIDSGIINPNLDPAKITQAYYQQAPGIVTVDELLTPQALQALRQFTLEATIWHEFKYKNGYLGAFMYDGFSCDLLRQMAEELPLAFPDIFKQHKLTHLWAFKCASDRMALDKHADFAAVNVNFWITPDDANLDPHSGGLVLWDKEVPADWEFKKYNNDQNAIDEFIHHSGAKKIKVPYKQNRALIFNSDLVHSSDEAYFKPGYENRRINITLLYGKREQDGYD